MTPDHAPRPTDPLRASYDAVADEYARRIAGELAHKPMDREFLDALADRVRGAGAVLDVGCGPGHVAAYLHARGVDVRGVDLSPAMVAQARALHPDVPFVVGDFAALDAADGAYAAVVAFYALIHVPRGGLAAAFGELRRVLQPGGALLAAFHLGDEVRHLDEWWGRAVDVDFVFYTAAELRAAAEAAGLVVEALVERAPYPDVEAQTTRGYLAARAPEPPAGDPQPHV